MSKDVCVSPSDFRMYLFLLVCIFAYLSYVLMKQREGIVNVDLTSHLAKQELEDKVRSLQSDLHGCKLEGQKCETNLQQCHQLVQQANVQNVALNRIYNPLTAPERSYPGGRLTKPPYYEYQLVGYVYQGTERYPLFGRHKFPGRSDRWEYYVVDETRNRLKIPFRTRNDNELFDGDVAEIPTLGSFSVKLYEYETMRYNPTVF